MKLICPVCGHLWCMGALHTEARARLQSGLGPSASSSLNEIYSSIYSEIVGEFSAVGCTALKFSGIITHQS